MSVGAARHALDALFLFHGRIGRPAFIGYIVFIGFFIFGLIVYSISTAGNDRTKIISAMSSAAFLLAMVALWPFAALLIKRLHDLNRSAWHCLWLAALWFLCLLGDSLPDPVAIMVEIASAGTAMWLFAVPGNAGPNFYGAAAK